MSDISLRLVRDILQVDIIQDTYYFNPLFP
jgi:hypothetical protein